MTPRSPEASRMANAKYYARLKADPARYFPARARHNAARKRNGTWNKKSWKGRPGHSPSAA